MRSLRTKIMVIIGGAAALAMIISGIITVMNVGTSSLKIETNVASTSTELVTAELDDNLNQYITIVEQIACNTAIQTLVEQSADAEQMQAHPYYNTVLKTLINATETDSHILAVYFAANGKTVGLDGSEWIPDESFNLSEKEYWFASQEQIDKGFIIAEPYQDVDTGNMVITVSAPLYDTSNTNIIGVTAIDVTIDNLSELVLNSKNPYEGAVKMLVTEDGTIIGSPDKEVLMKNISDMELDQKFVDEVMEPTDSIIPFGSGKDACYGTVFSAETSGWKVIYLIPASQFEKAATAARNITLGVTVISVIVLLAVIALVTRGIVAPLRKLTGITEELAAGNLDTEIDIDGRDEIGQLAGAMESLVARLREYIDYIDEVSAALDEFATGHLEINLEHAYDGDFAKIKEAILQMSKVFKGTIGQIVETSERVASGSVEIANASQMLAQGATNQASTTEQLTATINELSERVTKNADHAMNASEQVKIVGGAADESNEQMREMINAIAEINDKSSEIGKIIKVIEDIAFQTNILALNAAVEAARAGEAGKGFAVVADEVRNLANKSQEAASETTRLIEETVRAVENGTAIANITGEKLGQVIEGVEQTIGLINEISSASVGQATALRQTLEGVEQISSVVQTNAATAEESSAASDELSKQANELQNVASRFKF